MLKTEIECCGMLAVLGRSLQPNAIRKLTLLLGNKQVVSLAAGAPSFETFPIEELAEISARVIRDHGKLALQYGPTRGQPALVEEVAGVLRSRGIEGCKSSEIVMTTG